MLQKMQQCRPHDEASNQHASLAQRRTVPRAHPSTKERHRTRTVRHRSPSPNSSAQTTGTGSNGLDHRARRCVDGGSCQCVQPTHWRACCSSDPLPTPSGTVVSAHCRRSAAMPCIAEERGGALRRVPQAPLAPPPPLPPRHRAPPRPVLANFKWECITRHCSRTGCRRSKGRSVYVSIVLFVFVLFIWRL